MKVGNNASVSLEGKKLSKDQFKSLFVKTDKEGKTVSKVKKFDLEKEYKKYSEAYDKLHEKPKEEPKPKANK